MQNRNMVVVSACLLGVNCRYDGGSQEHPEALELLREGRAVPVCPEQLGGLPTPRDPVEIVNGTVADRNGVDHTGAIERGAQEAVRLAKLAGCTSALLQPRSPSCGCGTVYDGTFSGRLISGDGLFTRALRDNGIAPRAADHDD